jgi:DNA-binding PadR family transcriptional regulator
MSLAHVLLGLLQETPRSGYDLSRAIREQIDPVWSAGFSQIYPELARLRRRGWVLQRTLGPRQGPRRLLYRVTASGRRELRRWLQEPAPPPRHNDAGLARLAFLDTLAPTERRRVLRAFEAALTAEIERLRRPPSPSGSRAFARRASIEELDALRRFARSGEGPAGPSAVSPRKKR